MFIEIMNLWGFADSLLRFIIACQTYFNISANVYAILALLTAHKTITLCSRKIFSLILFLIFNNYPVKMHRFTKEEQLLSKKYDW